MTFNEEDIVAAWKKWYSDINTTAPDDLQTWDNFTPEQQAEYFISLLKDVKEN